MSGLFPRPQKVEQDFTDARLTGFRGCSALAPTEKRGPPTQCRADRIPYLLNEKLSVQDPRHVLHLTPLGVP